MKIFIVLVMLISTSYAGTLEISQKIASSLQSLTKNTKDGTYSVTLLGTYDYQIEGEEVTLPVLLMSPQPVSVPAVMKGCEEAESISCNVAQYLTTWLERVNPEGDGTFRLEFSLYGKGVLKETTVFVKNSEF